MSSLRIRIAGLVCMMVALAAVAAAAQTPARPGRNALAQVRDFQAVAERVRPALVQVLTTAETVRPELGGLPVLQRGSGSGVVLDPGGYIVTNAHVVQGARRIQVVLGTPSRPPDGHSILKAQGRTAGAQLVGVDLETDLAVLLALLPPLRARAGVVVAAAAADARPSADPPLPGDVIYSLNNRGVASLAQLREALQGLAPGTPIVLQVERAGALRYVVLERD